MPSLIASLNVYHSDFVSFEVEYKYHRCKSCDPTSEITRWWLALLTIIVPICLHCKAIWKILILGHDLIGNKYLITEHVVSDHHGTIQYWHMMFRIITHLMLSRFSLYIEASAMIINYSIWVISIPYNIFHIQVSPGPLLWQQQCRSESNWMNHHMWTDWEYHRFFLCFCFFF